MIAQFGKNSGYIGENLTGTYLMELVGEILARVQREIGGGVVYLECEDNEKLLHFYQREDVGFRIFNERFSADDGIKYIQLFKLI